MLKKILITLLSLIFIGCGVFFIVTLVFFMTPSHKTKIHLPSRIEDSADLEQETPESEADSTYDNIYLADVHQSLSLRVEPDSNAETVIQEGLAPMTHMQLIHEVEGKNFAYVLVINGPYKGYEGYVNRDYITRLGEMTRRVGEQE